MRPNVEGGRSSDVETADEVVWKPPLCWLPAPFHPLPVYRNYTLLFTGQGNPDEMCLVLERFYPMGDT